MGSLAAPIALCLAAGLGCTKTSRDLTVAAAASLTNAFQDLGAAYSQAGGERVRFSFQSSGILAHQIEQGAPFDAFAAASVSYIDRLVASGHLVGDSKRIYAVGRLALWSKEPLPTALDGLRRVRRIAIANPDHAPYGTAARQVLEKIGLWQELVDANRIVRAANVRGALEWAQRGEADISLVALSLTLRAKGHSRIVDEALHAPLEQAIAVVRSSKRVRNASAFIDFVDSDAGHEILRRHGLLQPGQALPDPVSPP